jgi:CHRD domain
VVVAHIHLGEPAIAGGVSVFLCGGGGRGSCSMDPTGLSGSVEGDIINTDVIGPTAQGIAANEFAEVVRALRAGAMYANVHTTGRPAGEIRGQIKVVDDDDHDR